MHTVYSTFIIYFVIIHLSLNFILFYLLKIYFLNKKRNTSEIKIVSVIKFTGTPADLLKSYYTKNSRFSKVYSYLLTLIVINTVRKLLKNNTRGKLKIASVIKFTGTPADLLKF